MLDSVADSGGVVGGWIAVLWRERMAGLITHLLRLVDAVGVDHVGLGTDMPAGVAATEMPDFSRHGEVPAALRAHGLDYSEVARICGGNWLRVFRANRAKLGPRPRQAYSH